MTGDGFYRIVVPTDFSASAEQAWALLHARMQGRRQRTQRIAIEPDFLQGASLGRAPKG